MISRRWTNRSIRSVDAIKGLISGPFTTAGEINEMCLRRARIDRVGGHFFVVDLNSSNGTRVNAAAVDTMVLGDGVLLELGNFPLIFSQQAVYPMGD